MGDGTPRARRAINRRSRSYDGSAPWHTKGPIVSWPKKIASAARLYGARAGNSRGELQLGPANALQRLRLAAKVRARLEAEVMSQTALRGNHKRCGTGHSEKKLATRKLPVAQESTLQKENAGRRDVGSSSQKQLIVGTFRSSYC